MKIRIISIENPVPLKGAPADLDCTNAGHSKFIRRRKYVENTLLPFLQKNFSYEASIFKAITPNDFTSLPDTPEGTFGIYKDYKIRVHYGSFGNFISNFMLWKECVDTNEPILILEDDAYLPQENVSVINSALPRYEVMHNNDNSILYLQSAIPSHPTNLHDYVWDSEGGGLIKIKSTGDLSGTAAYCVNPVVAKSLMERAMIDGCRATDGFIH